MSRAMTRHAPTFAVLAALAVALTLGGCANTPTDASHASTARSSYEQMQFERAQRLTRQGDLAEAALSWEILTVLRPDDASYAAQLKQVRADADRRADSLSEQARLSSKRGAWDEASRDWLGVLALRPKDPEAADALRKLEQERNARDLLGRPSRVTMRSRAVRAYRTPGDVDPARAPAFERNDLEHASMLAAQGEYDAAIALLKEHAGNRPDALTRDALADVHYRKALSLVDSDPKAAQAAVSACLQWNPRHAGARKLQAQLKGARTSVPGKRPASRATTQATSAP